VKRCVQDVMTRTVVVVRDSAPFKELVELMDEFRVSALPVVDADRHVVGVVSEGDLLLKEGLVEEIHRERVLASRRLRRDLGKARALIARDLMTSPALTIGPEAPLAAAARKMHEHNVKRLPVVDADGRLLGIVSRADLLRVFLRTDAEIAREVTEDVLLRTLWLPEGSIRVRVTDGVVHLDGMVERRSLVPVVLEMVEAVDGVVGVESELRWELDDVTASIGLMTPWGIPAGSLRPE
jgi:CBS-domain-containing membrane protein